MWRKRAELVEESERVIKDAVRARERTMSRAVKLLAAKPRSVRELRERLLEKNWTNAEIVEGVIEKLEEYKYLDDEQFAKDYAASKVRQKPVGRRSLQQSLSRKKLDKETVEQAIGQVFETTPESEVIDRAINRRLMIKGRPETREDIKKFYDHLLRQGFAYDLVSTRMRELAAGKFSEETE
jgi:regulatory protein